MKKIAVTTTLLLLSLCSFSQAAVFILLFGDKVASEKFHLSLDAGLNASFLPGLDNATPLYGVNFGMGTHIMLSEKWHLAPEIKPFSLRGANNYNDPIFEFDDANIETRKSRLVLIYLDIPLMLQRHFDNNMFISAGPQVSFLLTGKEETLLELSSETVLRSVENVHDNMNPIDFSVPVEFGYKLYSKSGKGMQLRLRYSYGLMELFDSETGKSSNQSLFQLILTFPFVEKPSE